MLTTNKLESATKFINSSFVLRFMKLKEWFLGLFRKKNRSSIASEEPVQKKQDVPKGITEHLNEVNGKISSLIPQIKSIQNDFNHNCTLHNFEVEWKMKLGQEVTTPVISTLELLNHIENNSNPRIYLGDAQRLMEKVNFDHQVLQETGNYDQFVNQGAIYLRHLLGTLDNRQKQVQKVAATLPKTVISLKKNQ